jgi:hypothetical protein
MVNVGDIYAMWKFISRGRYHFGSFLRNISSTAGTAAQPGSDHWTYQWAQYDTMLCMSRFSVVRKS